MPTAFEPISRTTRSIAALHDPLPPAAVLAGPNVRVSLIDLVACDPIRTALAGPNVTIVPGRSSLQQAPLPSGMPPECKPISSLTSSNAALHDPFTTVPAGPIGHMGWMRPSAAAPELLQQLPLLSLRAWSIQANVKLDLGACSTA